MNIRVAHASELLPSSPSLEGERSVAPFSGEAATGEGGAASVSTGPALRATPAQERLVCSPARILLAPGGPGTGKTRVLVERAARLAGEGAPDGSLAIITATRRAGLAARELFEALAPGTFTLHADSLVALALQQWGSSVKAVQPALLTFEEAATLLPASKTLAHATDRQRALAHIQHARTHLLPVPPEYASLNEEYAAQKTRRRLADSVDLLEIWLNRLELGERAALWQHVLVDDAHLLSPLGLRVVLALANAPQTSLYLTGIPDADAVPVSAAFAETRARFPVCEEQVLNENHRSLPDIIQSACAVRGKSPAELAALPMRGKPDTRTHMQLFHAPNAQREALWMVEHMRRLHQSQQGTSKNLEEPYAFNDMAVIVPSLAVLIEAMEPLRQELESRAIPYVMPERAPFWLEPRVAFLLALAGRRYGRPAPVPVPDPSSLPVTVWADGPAALLAKVQSLPQFDEGFRYSSAFAECVQAHQDLGGWLPLLDFARLRTPADAIGATVPDAVRIMTAQGVQGLEFRAVFVPALEQPFWNMPGTLDSNLNRELHTALSTARDVLFLSHAERRVPIGGGRDSSTAPCSALAALTPFFQSTRQIEHTRVTRQQISLLPLK